MSRISGPLLGFVVLSTSAAGLTGCSTMSTIRTEPPGANIKLLNKFDNLEQDLGPAPVEVELDDGFAPWANYTVVATSPGYEDTRAALVQDWNWTNIVVFGFLFGVVPVFFNGQEHRGEYVIELEPDGSLAAPPPVKKEEEPELLASEVPRS